MVNKTELRKEFLAKRKQLSPNQVADHSLQINSQFQKLFRLNPVSLVHIFLPIKRHNEIDTWPIIAFLRSENVKIVIPKSDFSSNTLKHFLLEKSTKLQENSWGIPEPINAKQVLTETIEMVLVPLVIFDQQGFRIGYGKGFYDKFLSECRPTSIKIGLSLFPPIEDIHPTNFDVKMDHCVLPERILTF